MAGGQWWGTDAGLDGLSSGAGVASGPPCSPREQGRVSGAATRPVARGQSRVLFAAGDEEFTATRADRLTRRCGAGKQRVVGLAVCSVTTGAEVQRT